MNHKDIIIFIFIIFFLQLHLQAQDQLKMEHFSSEEGFLGRFANELIQDRRGFIWIATVNGAYRFDGYSFKVYQNEGEGFVNTIYEDKQGRIWLGLHTSAVCIDPVTDSLKSYTYIQDPSGFDMVERFSEDETGNIWIASQLALFRLNARTGHFDLYEKGKGLHKDLRLRQPVRDREGNFWFNSLGSGLYHFNLNTEKFTQFKHNPDDPNSLYSNDIKYLSTDREGILWIINADGVINSFDPENELINTFRLPEADKTLLASLRNISGISKDKIGDLWLTTSDGLIRIHVMDLQLTLYRNDPDDSNSIRVDRLTTTFADRENNIWISPYELGLSRIDLGQSQFKVYQHTSLGTSLSDNIVRAIEIESNNTLWVGTQGQGLNRLDLRTGKFTYYLHDPKDDQSLSSNTVWALLTDSRGNLWVGTENGLNLFDPKTKKNTRFLPDPENSFSISGSGVTDLLEYSQGNLWLATFGGGLNHYDYQSNRFIHYLNDPDNPRSISANLITSIHEDHQGILWIGTAGRGLNRFDPNDSTATFTHFIHDPNNPQSLSSNGVWDIHEDQERNLWIGTWRGGLNLLDRETEIFHHFTEADGLANNTIQGIAEDDNGHLWITTINGLSLFNSKDTSFINYNQSDGLPGNVFSSIVKHSDTGEFYVGSQKGLIVFHPDSLSENLFIPPVYITSLEYIPRGSDQAISVKGVSLKEKVRLSHRDDIINIQFSALSFSKTEKNQYRYQVEGLQDKWIELGTQRQISFTNLNPGTYTLRVMGSNGDGVWNSMPTDLILIITPPWWRTTWAYAFYVLIFLGAIFSFFQWRTIALRKRQKLLEQTVVERTNEVMAEQKRSNELLLNILPVEIARELKETGHSSPKFFEEVSILFTDFKGYTNIVASIPGKKLVQELDDIFKAYDDIIESEGLEKIQTVGDAYLAACGLPKTDPRHAEKCILAGKRIIAHLHERNQRSSIKWKVRVGIHSGSITAGVIGKKKFSYDIFGDSVNIAARMESSGEAGKINISAYTHDLIKEKFSCTYRGKINAKGKGELDMYFVD